MIRQETITATVPAGETGITADSSTIHGEILKIAMNVTGNSMDINLDSFGEQSAQAIIDYTGNTDSTFYPRAFAETIAGVDLVYIAAGEEIPVPFAVFGRLRLTLASAAATESVKMTITYRN